MTPLHCAAVGFFAFLGQKLNSVSDGAYARVVVLFDHGETTSILAIQHDEHQQTTPVPQFDKMLRTWTETTFTPSRHRYASNHLVKNSVNTCVVAHRSRSHSPADMMVD